MIAGICTAYNEADIIGITLGHLLAEGVDVVYVAVKPSGDATEEIVKSFGDSVRCVIDERDYHYQAAWANELANMAHSDGASWLLPCDADEFPYATEGGTIAEALADCPYEKLLMKVWPHKDFNLRYEEPHRLPKVCYRWRPGAQVTMGSHDVSIPGGTYGVLNMRELQYRSFDHFCKKIADGIETLDPEARARGDAAHIFGLENKTRDEMRTEWDTMQAAPSVYDPIPSHAL